MTPETIAITSARLDKEEGVRPMVYKDTLGNLTAGVGRNLSAVPFSPDEIALMKANDINRAIAFLDAHVAWWRTLNEPRQSVLLDMTFTLESKILGFKNMLADLARKDYALSASEILNSTYARQVGARAVYLSTVMKNGTY